jgi:hypothetical protein
VCEDIDYIELARHMLAQWRDFISKVRSLWVSIRSRKFQNWLGNCQLVKKNSTACILTVMTDATNPITERNGANKNCINILVYHCYEQLIIQEKTKWSLKR